MLLWCCAGWGQAWHGAGAKSEWVGEELSRSERPDLGAAKVVVAGTRPILGMQTAVMR